MHIRVDDGVAIFATHFIYAKIDRTNQGVSQKLAPFQLEQDGIVIYPDNNMVKVEVILQEFKIPYIVEILDYEQHKPKCQGIKYQSRTECINHLIINDFEPDSQVIPNLKKKLIEKENKIKSLEDKFLKFEQRLMKGGL